MIALVPMEEWDLELVLAWRNNPLVYQGLYTQSQENRHLTWVEHKRWWSLGWEWDRFLIQYENRKVGYVYVRFDKTNPEVGIVVGEVGLWGQGVGKAALLEIMRQLRQEGFTRLETTILWDNRRSIRLFEGCGWERKGTARESEWYYEVAL